ncbi:calcineurin-like phosphoesterase family protein [Kamptonema cortianum]|nr:calcineurin-like phosphoesterase family protein [Geitlerinema splendidum]MDK3158849.1 calcineurin-like phosphoesterase family protein [Kamptonema cortianum]
MSILATIIASTAISIIEPASVATGYVFEDTNRNGVRDRGERGITGVYVSDQDQVTKTDRQGKWTLPVKSNDVVFFVVKPRNWMTPVDQHQLPKFYYSHKPEGSPKQKVAGVEPTGPLPASIDFPLHRSQEPNQFEALVFGDTQTRNVKEVEYLRKDIIEPIIGKTKARFGMTLGDIVFDDLTVLDPIVKAVSLLEMPWYNVLGNHDINFDAADDADTDETFQRWFGPNYYSFDHGPVHFVVMDNVHWTIPEGAERGSYIGKFGERQLAWLREDLKTVPMNRLVVFAMHIPLTSTTDRQDFYRLIESRPFSFSVSAHAHFQEHHFIGEGQGWKGKEPHHHLIHVTACGSWWQGSLDPMGIPHTQMRDGAPNGYSLFRFDGNQYSIHFRAARRPDDYQIQIHAPDEVEFAASHSITLYANVFAGNERSKVEYRVGDSPFWKPMAMTSEPDPLYVAMHEADKTLTSPLRPLPAPMNSPHLWKATIRTVLTPGIVPIHVRTTDMFGQTFYATKGIVIK